MAMQFPLLHRFRRAEDGAALVEFAISLPLILVVSFGTIDSMRLFWSYQAAVAGVRDAARYVARGAPADICSTAGGNLSGYNTQVGTIIGSTIDGGAVYTGGVTFSNVSATLTCVGGLSLRQAEVPVARVSADMNIAMPFSGILTLVGGDGFGTITTRIVEDARVFGL
jgi:Flp pilus assembly protein TadG